MPALKALQAGAVNPLRAQVLARLPVSRELSQPDCDYAAWAGTDLSQPRLLSPLRPAGARLAGELPPNTSAGDAEQLSCAIVADNRAHVRRASRLRHLHSSEMRLIDETAQGTVTAPESLLQGLAPGPDRAAFGLQAVHDEAGALQGLAFGLLDTAEAPLGAPLGSCCAHMPCWPCRESATS